MLALNEYYLAGEVAEAIGIHPITLRAWRERGYCQLGYTELVNGEENARARRRYTPVNVCQIAIAQELITFGFSHRRAFEWVCDDRRNGAIIDACAAGVVDLEIPDLIIGITGGGPADKRWTTMTMRYFSGGDTKSGATQGLPRADFSVDIHVSAIVARILGSLSSGFGPSIAATED